MKKFSFMMVMLMMFSMVMCFSSCNGCSKSETVPTEDSTAVVDNADTGLVVERLIATDREHMYAQYSNDYRWFESCILLNDFLDEECDGSIAGVSNIFQAIHEKDKGADVFVVMFAHTPDTTSIEVVNSFWVEDLPLNDENIKVSFKEAFEKVMAVNYPKPHSKHVVLRKELGPINANPQYIFGNQRAQLYVDAVTGDVTDKNPVFPEDVKLAKPLGEWP